MKLALLALLVLLPVAVLAQTNIPYTNCGKATDHIKILSATASQWPPTTTAPTTVNVQGALDEPVVGGTYSLSVSVDGFPIVNQQGQLSSLPNVTFPIQPGTISVVKTFQLPSIIPAGTSVSISVSAMDSLNQELICLQLSATIPSASTIAHKKLSTKQMTQLLDGTAKKALLKEFSKSPLTITSDCKMQKSNKPSFGDAVDDVLGGIIEGDMLIDFEPSELKNSVPIPYTSCAQGSDVVEIQSVTANEWPPVLGTQFNVTAAATVLSQITGGTYSGVVSIDGFPLFSKNGSLADLNITLPIPAGPMTITKGAMLPASIPFSGSVGLQVSANDQNNNQLFCVGITLNL